MSYLSPKHERIYKKLETCIYEDRRIVELIYVYQLGPVEALLQICTERGYNTRRKMEIMELMQESVYTTEAHIRKKFAGKEAKK